MRSVKNQFQLFFLLLCLLWFGFSCQRAKDIGLYEKNSQAIYGGSPGLIHPAVGGIWVQVEFEDNQTTTERCTGTLIASRVVLTAAHCMNLLKEKSISKEVTFEIDFPVDGLSQSSRYASYEVDVTKFYIHPDYKGTPTPDIGLFILKHPVLGVSPIPFFANTIGQAWLGKEVLLIGYGSTGAVSGRKYVTTTKITAIDGEARGFQFANSIFTKSQNTGTCVGDSGGPVLVEQNGVLQVLAVNSATFGPKLCEDATAISFLTGPASAWIQSIVDRHNSCSQTSDCSSCQTCDSRQCMLKTTSGYNKRCRACTMDADCGSSGYCVLLSSGNYCVQRCKGASAQCCPTGQFCTTDGTHRKYCLPNNLQCSELSCKTNADCSSHERCDRGVCRTLPLPTQPSNLCQPCKTDADCAGLLCHKITAQTGLCLQRCSSNRLCPRGFRCASVRASSQNAYCIPSNGRCRKACTENKDCASNRCVGGFCEQSGLEGESCWRDKPCGDELECYKNRCVRMCGNDAQQTSCSSGQTCFRDRSGQSYCVAEGSKVRGVGESCDMMHLCKPGLFCSKTLDVCVEACSPQKACSHGGTCQSTTNSSDSFCLCPTSGACLEQATCRSFVESISVCVPPPTSPPEQGCQGCQTVAVPHPTWRALLLFLVLLLWVRRFSR